MQQVFLSQLRCHTSVFHDLWFSPFSPLNLRAYLRVSGKLKAIRGRGRPLHHQGSSGVAGRFVNSNDDAAPVRQDEESDRSSTKQLVVRSYTKKMSAYSSQGELLNARKVFDEMPFRDSVAYNVMIRDYIRGGRVEEAREVFDGMPTGRRSTISWNTMIMGYSISSGSPRRTHLALKLFIVMPEDHKDAFTWTTVISGLARDGRVADSLWLFKQSSERANPVAWASLLSSFQQNGLAHETLMLFKDMLSLGMEPAPHSLTSALAAAADLPSLFVGRQLYSHVLRRGLGRNTHVGNSVISMFMKSGSLDNARILFSQMPRRDLFTWNSMITGLAHHGLGAEAISVFHLMQRLGFRPDAISFLGVLQGCSHCGRVNEGRLYFERMQRDFNICPQPEHYVCLVDILARAGLLRKAAELISDMPFGATPVVWRALLNGCRISGELELGLCVANQMLELEPDNAATCLMVMEMYKAAGRCVEVATLREWMRSKVRKELGYSWIEIEGKPYLFTTRDETHQESDNIYMVLKLLTNAMDGHAD